MYCYRNNLLPHYFSTCFSQTVKPMAIAPEKPKIIACIITEII